MGFLNNLFKKKDNSSKEIDERLVEQYFKNGINCSGRRETTAEAVTWFDKAIAISPNNPDLSLHRGYALFELERYKDAIASFDKVIKILKNQRVVTRGEFDVHSCAPPEISYAWSHRGLALTVLGKHKEAVKSYENGFSGDKRTGLGYGVSLSAIGKLNDAIDQYDFLISYYPEYAEAWYNRGVALCSLGRNKEAVESYDRAISIRPDYTEAKKNRDLLISTLN